MQWATYASAPREGVNRKIWSIQSGVGHGTIGNQDSQRVIKVFTEAFMMRRERLTPVACLPVCFVGGTIPVWGQQCQGSFTGAVTDLTRAVIPGAQITVLEVDKGFTRSARTRPEGS